jgi:adenosylmethionine-8-amino-7-oxononanoate aminotransferase
MSQALLERDKKYVWRPFTQVKTAPDPMCIVSGKDATLIDTDGNEILDMISSWWVNLHGHTNPVIAKAIADQAQKLEQVIFATCTHEPAVDLAEGIANILPGDLNRVFYSDDGSTAIEVAMKMSLQYFRNQGITKRTRFVALDGAYHGDTVGAMSMGKSSGWFDAWQEMLFSVDTMPNAPTWDGDEEIEAKEAAALKALDDYISANGDTVIAAIVEPLVQGASGMRMCRPQFLKAWVERLKAAGALIIFDEVMTGFGRLGDVFACLKLDIVPDMVCVSKGITGGFLPLSATITHDGIYNVFLDDDVDKAFLHGHSYTANPLGCAAGVASLKMLLDPACAQRRADIEAFHRQAIPEIAKLKGISRPRVTGTISAVSFAVEETDSSKIGKMNIALKEFFKADNMLIRPLGNVIYLLPPYCVTDAELTRAYDSISRAVKTVLGE